LEFLSVIEYIAVVFGIVAVYLNVRQNIWCWLTGLLQVALYVIIFYQAKLYSDFLLHIFYVFMQLYGWYHWLYGGAKKDALPVTVLNSRHRLVWALLIVIGTWLWGWFMAARTDAALPYWDAFTTVASVVAMWFMARKYLESWILWIIVDVVAVGVYYVKDLLPTTGLYIVFLGLAAAGFIEWKRSMLAQQKEAVL